MDFSLWTVLNGIYEYLHADEQHSKAIYMAAAEITRILTLNGLASALSIEKIKRTNFALLFKSKCIAV